MLVKKHAGLRVKEFVCVLNSGRVVEGELILNLRLCLLARRAAQSAVTSENQFFKLYIASYNLLNIDRVISKVEVRKGREAGTTHRWFTGALLLD